MKYLLNIAFLILVMVLNACQESDGHKPFLYLDAGQPVDKRVESLLAQMSLEEKVAQMCQYVGLEHMKQAEQNLSKEEMEQSDAHGFYPDLHSSEVEKLVEQGLIGSFLHVVTVQEANYLQKLAQKSRLKIPLLIGIDAIHGTGLVRGATIYPTPIGLASTWDTCLVKQLSAETADEMRATGSTWTFTPNLDVARDARWGRVGETFGEDPFLVGEMGKAMIKGLQEKENGQFNVIACAKHLIAGSESVNGLNGAPTDLSERTIREVYLPPYKAAVDAGVFSVMTAHNELNGIPCHADKWMMTEVLRKELGFNGFIVSDWMDIERLASRHFVAKNQKEACLQTVDAGMDMHMHGPGFLQPVVDLVKEGRLSEERIDASVRLLLEAKIRLGLFENPYVNEDQTAGILFNKKHQASALEAAQKSIVLLKNDDQLLPLSKGKHLKIFVSGPNADNQTLLGDWTAKQPEENFLSVVEALERIDPTVVFDYLSTGDNPRHITPEHIDEAVLRARQADLAILVVGENSFRWAWSEKTCGENSARSDIGLAGLQQQLIKAVYKTGTPVIVILVNGRPLATEWVADHVPTLVEAWEPGSMGGQALAQILYGEINPSGKLPVTIPRSAGHLLSVYNHKPSHYFHSYVTTRTAPLFAFGFGLSYSEFNYQNLRLDKQEMTRYENIVLKVEISNIGEYDGEEVVQLYIRDKVSSVSRPVKELKAFRRVAIKSGEVRQVTFEITPEMLQFLDKEFKPVIEAGEFIAMVGRSSRDKDLLSIPFNYRQ